MSATEMHNKTARAIQDMRRAHREKMKKYPVSTIYLQVIGTGAPGAPRSLYVFTEQCRYLFNCGEGTQRLAYEHKVKLSMLEHIFITHKSWDNVGGLPGALLTLQDTGVPEISVHGPPGIDSLYYDTKSFMRFGKLKLNYCHYKANKGVFKDGPIVIKYVPIWPEYSDTKSALQDDATRDMTGCQSSDEEGSSSQRIRQRSEESISCKDVAIAYICRPIPKPGTLLSSKCQEMGVPLGPLMGELKRGNDVTLPCGRVVKASVVTEPDDPGPVFIVIEIPTLSHLAWVLNTKAFDEHQEGTAVNRNDIAEIIIHFSPLDVVADPRYQEWVNRFPPSTSHLYLNESNTCMGSERVHKIQYKLNHLYPESFPVLNDSGISISIAWVPYENSDRTTSLKKLKCCHINNSSETSVVNKVSDNKSSKCGNLQCSYDQSSCGLIEVSTLLTYHLRPNKKFETSSCLSLDPEAYINECYQDESFQSAYNELKMKLEDVKSKIPKNIKERQYPNILLLGTGSCIPNKTRNTSGIVFNISQTCSIIMDCGEGTYGQLVRFMGVEESDKVLRKLKGIYVSHLHADHHIGLIRLLTARKKAFKKVNLKVPELLLVGPALIIVYLVSYDANFNSISDLFTLIPSHNFNRTNRQNTAMELMDDEEKVKLLEYWEIQSLETCLVPHCPHAYGVSFILPDGWKLVYSGDTMPCDQLVSIGLDCDLLIHEATMEDALIEDAKDKRHSTISGALQVAADMKAKYVLLTHFSQRYAKVPLLNSVPDNVAVAFDNMQISLKDLPCLPFLYPALVAAFSEDYDEMIEKTKKRKARELEKGKTQ